MLPVSPGLEVHKRKSSTVFLPQCQAAASHRYLALPGRGLEDSSSWRKPIEQVSGGKPKSHLGSALKPRAELLKITTATAMAKRISARNIQRFQVSLSVSTKGSGSWSGLCCGICSSVACWALQLLQNSTSACPARQSISAPPFPTRENKG